MTGRRREEDHYGGDGRLTLKLHLEKSWHMRKAAAPREGPGPSRRCGRRSARAGLLRYRPLLGNQVPAGDIDRRIRRGGWCPGCEA